MSCLARGLKAVDQEVEQVWEERMEEGAAQRAILKEFLGDLSREDQDREIENMEIEDIEKELAAAGCKHKPEDDDLMT